MGVGWGGQHYKPSVVVGGGGVDFEIKIWQGGRRKNDGFTKKLPSPPPPADK